MHFAINLSFIIYQLFIKFSNRENIDSPKNINLIVGTVDHKDQQIVYKGEKWIINGCFSIYNMYSGDIALIKTDSNILMSDTVSSICLPLKDSELVSRDVILSGWEVSIATSHKHLIQRFFRSITVGFMIT